MKDLLSFVLVLVCLSNLAIAEETQKVYGNVTLFKTVDDFTDEISEGIGVINSGFMGKQLILIKLPNGDILITFNYQSLIMEDQGRLKYRINKGTPHTVPCILSAEGQTAFISDVYLIKQFVQELVIADRSGGEVKVVIMVDGESDTKDVFDYSGVSRAVEASKNFKQFLPEETKTESNGGL